MRRTRRNPPPQRTHEEREAARAERERRRAARPGDAASEERLPGPAADERRQAAAATEGGAAVHDWSRAEPLPGDPILPAPATAAARGAPPRRGTSGRARNTVIFSVLTGFSRVAGLAREIVARSYFGTSGAMSAFTLAFQVPNLIRALVADAALSSAFVPVFSELLEKQRRREALQLASALAGLLLVALGTLTLAFIALAPVLMPLFTGDQSTPALDDLTVGLSQVLFPIVVLLGLNGLVVGILNAHEHFTIPALAPLVWNAVIIAGLVGLTPLFEGDDQLYAYAIGVVAGTVVQLAMCLPQLRRTGYPLRFSFAFRRDPRVRRVLLLMLPVSLGIGLINVSLLINSAIGFLVSEEAPTAIDAAFRIYMLPQGMFSVAVATVLFPRLSRLAARADTQGFRETVSLGLRQIGFLLVPASAVAAVLAVPITRLLYERGAFSADQTTVVAQALAAFALGLTFNGTMLMLNRTFFSLQSPWVPTAIAVGNLALNVALNAILYRVGIWGIPLATSLVNIAGTAALLYYIRRRLGRVEGRALASSYARITIAAALAAGAAYGAWLGLDEALGRALGAQVVSVGLGIVAAMGVFLALAWLIRIRELNMLLSLVRRSGRTG